MHLHHKFWAALALAASLLAPAVWAQDAKPADATSALAQEALKKDAVCTKCHDASENAPVLSLYQTRHGVRGDARTPGCQSCHGASAEHLKGSTTSKTRPAPDHVFKKGVYAASSDQDRTGQCLSCHS